MCLWINTVATLARSDNPVEEPSPHHSKLEGLSSATATGREKENSVGHLVKTTEIRHLWKLSTDVEYALL
jgi:hypothetical protein